MLNKKIIIIKPRTKGAFCPLFYFVIISLKKFIIGFRVKMIRELN